MSVALQAREVAEKLRPTASEFDRERRFPAEHFEILAGAGLLGLLVPKEHGGLGGGLADLAAACEAVGWASGSTGLCFLMHCCGTAVIGAKATPDQAARWLPAAATGETLATLAFSERATGAHFYSPEIKAERRNGSYTLSGRKSFVTSGGHARLYPVLVQAPGAEGLDVLVVTPDLEGVSFQGSWDGIGMTGNSSIEMNLDGVSVPGDHLIGKEGDGVELVFNVVAPTFLVGLAALNVGLAQAALEASIEHATARKHPGGQSLAEVPAIQIHLAEMGQQTEAARALVGRAAAAGDGADSSAVPLVMQAKVFATEAAIDVTNIGMQVCGGQGYTRSLPIERYWRDARAGAVMAPTNDVLKEWVGKILAGLPLF
ncbi:MAG: acyl-CoA dehydrogenase family protein [Actinomycetota bacterium]